MGSLSSEMKAGGVKKRQERILMKQKLIATALATMVMLCTVSALSGGMDFEASLAQQLLGQDEQVVDSDIKIEIKKLDALIAESPGESLLHRRRAVLHFMNGNPSAALTDAEISVKLSSTCSKCYTIRGMAKMHLGQANESVGDFSKAIKLEKGNHIALYHRGVAYASMGKGEKALDDLNRALILEPNSTSYFTIRGMLHLEHRRIQEAISDLTAATRLNGRNHVAYHQLGVAYYRSKKIPEAVAAFTTSISLDSTKAEVYNLRGLMYTILQDWPRSLEDFNKAIVLDDSETSFFNNRAYSLFKTGGDLQLALSDIQRVITRDPKPSNLDTRAEIYYALGEKDKAYADYCEIMRKLNGKEPETSKYKKNLEHIARYGAKKNQ
jgi:tetratricopeptide (TPR) repeat protein